MGQKVEFMGRAALMLVGVAVWAAVDHQVSRRVTSHRGNR